jgi:NAD(P)-dependent dehydrogenase (short-subunit alcohol dehydrogenase family)
MTARMDGRTVLVTGGNTGIGKETVVALAGAGARVVFTARDATKGDAALADARARSGSDAIEVMALDLASFAAVRDFVRRFTHAHDHLDVLVNNAGAILTRRTETVDGHETTLQVNHLSPFLLTNELREVLVAGDEARVVNVSSTVHSNARRGLDFDDLESRKHFRGGTVYARSKLANILFTRELARRWRDTGVTANAVHPGFVASGFGKDGDAHGLTAVTLRVLQPFALTPEQGARTQVHVASAPELAGITGGYWVKCAPAQPSRAARDDAAAARLWEVSETLVG